MTQEYTTKYICAYHDKKHDGIKRCERNHDPQSDVPKPGGRVTDRISVDLLVVCEERGSRNPHPDHLKPHYISNGIPKNTERYLHGSQIMIGRTESPISRI